MLYCGKTILQQLKIYSNVGQRDKYKIFLIEVYDKLSNSHKYNKLFILYLMSQLF